MQFLLALVAVALIAGSLAPRYLAWKRSDPSERAFALRFTLFTWLLGVLFLLAFVFLPNKGRVVMLLPAFLAGVTLVKWWKNSRARLRREAELQSSFDRARRVN